MFLTTYFVFLSGSTDGRIHIWNAENGQKVCVLNGDHKSAVQCVLVLIHKALLIALNLSFFLSQVQPKVHDDGIGLFFNVLLAAKY